MNKMPIVNKRKFTDSEIAVMAIYRLGGMLHHIHLEDVAITAAELAPKSFRWKKYPEQVDKESVRLALKNELKNEQGRIFGSIKNGWMLTPYGFSWCMVNVGPINPTFMKSINEEIVRVKRSKLFAKIVANKSIEILPAEVNEFLRVDEYFSMRNKTERVLLLRNISVLDAKLQKVMDILLQRYPIELEALNQ